MAYEVRMSDWSSDVCSAYLNARSGGIRALHFSAETRKEGRGMHPFALTGAFAAPAVKHNLGLIRPFTISHLRAQRRFWQPAGIPREMRESEGMNRDEIGRAADRERVCQYV